MGGRKRVRRDGGISERLLVSMPGVGVVEKLLRCVTYPGGWMIIGTGWDRRYWPTVTAGRWEAWRRVVVGEVIEWERWPIFDAIIEIKKVVG